MKRCLYPKICAVLFFVPLLVLLSGVSSFANNSDFLLGLNKIDELLPFYCRQMDAVREPSFRRGDEFPPLRTLLSRVRYWAQDRHLDVVIQLNGAASGGEVAGTMISVGILNADGDELADFRIEPPGERFIFYPGIPRELLEDGAGKLVIAWIEANGAELASSVNEFRVERFPEPVRTPGVISLTVPNEPCAVEKSFPVTIGVPFPRGALYDTANLRLVAVDGGERREIPMQVNEIARWSKFGSVKWTHIDFAVDLPGTERKLELEYGPEVSRKKPGDIHVEINERFPVVEAGQLRFSDGLWFDAEGNGDYVKVLDERALRGAFVEHEDGRVYRMADTGDYEIEESGSEKIVLKREGWYAGEEGGKEFCKYVTRYIIHHDSPVVRIFHSWIFTGDGNRDRIANMGWEFALGEELEPAGLLSTFGEEGEWLEGDYLLQWDFEHFDVVEGGRTREYAGGRASGAAVAEGKGIRLYFGTKDFWQNYPSEIEFSEGSLWFHNWPRHNRPAGYTLDGELIMTTGEPALASAARHDNYEPGKLTRSEWKLNVMQARFAHEGGMLDFRLPQRMTEDPIWSVAMLPRAQQIWWEKGNPESANAQGISRTEEMWIYLTPEDKDDGEAVRILEGLNNETLRGVVSPEWMGLSGAFYRMHPQDWEKYTEEERVFEQLALAPGRWQDRLGTYGMWIYGDLHAWQWVSMDRLEPIMYRGLRKGHHGWPYSWIPYARSGDSRLFKIAEAATRQNIDANYCHFVGEEMEDAVFFGRFPRRTGFIGRAPLPWTVRRHAYSRCYEGKMYYYLNAWHLSGFHRARDLILDWMEITKIEEDLLFRGPIRMGQDYRHTQVVWKSYLEVWKETFDPWFLAAAHALAEGVLEKFETEENFSGHFWAPAERDFMFYTGDRRFHEPCIRIGEGLGGHWDFGSWQRTGAPMAESSEYAWRLTGEEYHLRRVSHFLDWMKAAVWEGEDPDYYRGYYASGGWHGPPQFTGWALQYFPFALSAVEDAGYRPDPIPELFQVEARNPVIAFKKRAGGSVSLRLRAALHRPPEGAARYLVTAPDGTEMFEGEWQTKQEKNVDIPADAPSGEYRLEIRNSPGLVVPVIEDVDMPEVLLYGRDGRVLLGGRNNQVWFYVPEGTERFQVQIPLRQGHVARRVSVWSPEGLRVWDMNYYQKTYEGDDSVRAVIDVKYGQAGKLWRITLPNTSRTSFRMDSQIPPVYSVDRDRWFMPEARE